MILIASGAYIEVELQSIFGKIPPSFLPVKNKRLFVLQSEFFGNEKIKHISLPEDFEIDFKDQLLLEELNYTIVRIPASKNLGESIAFCIINYSDFHTPLNILLGDTLFLNFKNGLNFKDCFSVSVVDDYYNWAKVENVTEEKVTFSGYFSFSDKHHFLKLLTRTNYNFEKSLNQYKTNFEVNLYYDCTWLDFGHHNTYFRSKTLLSTERDFNKLMFSNNTFTKTSRQKEKMSAEADWFKTLPLNLKIHTPHLLGEIDNEEIRGYTIEYLFNATLSELFVFGKLPIFVWDRIINDSFSFLENLSSNKTKSSNSQNFGDLVIQKTIDRLKNIENSGIEIYNSNTYNGNKTPSLIEICRETKICLDSIPFDDHSIVHGDFCFSNVLYDFQSQIVKVIDPRGISLEGKITNGGNIIYDLGKFFHSIVGLYDLIISGYYKLEFSKNNFEFEILDLERFKGIQKLFLSKSFNEFPMNSAVLWALNINLFLSMIPLHSDNQKRQNALVANALRLYIEMKTNQNG